MTLPYFPDVSPDVVISDAYVGDLSVTLSPTDPNGYDAYSISRLYDPSPTNAWVVAYRIDPVNSSLGYVTGSTFVIPSSELPPVGSTYTFYIYAYRFAAGGGEQQYYYANSFTITRSNPVVLPNFPDVSPNPVITYAFTGDLSLTLSPVASDGLDAYSISRLYDPNPTNQWVSTYRIPAVNSPAEGYVTGSTFVMPESELPTSGTTYNFYIYAYRFSAGGGEQQYYYANTFTISRQSAPPPIGDTGYGFQVWDSSSKLVVSVTDRLVRYVSYYTGTLTANQSTTISVPGLTNDGTWGFNSEGGDGLYVRVTYGSTGVLNVQNLSSLSRVYNIQVFRV